MHLFKLYFYFSYTWCLLISFHLLLCAHYNTVTWMPIYILDKLIFLEKTVKIVLFNMGACVVTETLSKWNILIRLEAITTDMVAVWWQTWSTRWKICWVTCYMETGSITSCSLALTYVYYIYETNSGQLRDISLCFVTSHVWLQCCFLSTPEPTPQPPHPIPPPT